MSEKEPFSKFCVLCKLFASDTFQNKKDSAERIEQWKDKGYIKPKTARAKLLLFHPVSKTIIEIRRRLDRNVLG